MPTYNFEGIKGLTARDRELWEKQNIAQLNSMGYNSLSEGDKIRAFRNASIRNKFGGRKDFSQIKALSDDQKDSIFSGKLSIEDALKPKKKGGLDIDTKKLQENVVKASLNEGQIAEADRINKLKTTVNSTYSPNKTKTGETHSYYEDLALKQKEMQSSEAAFGEAYQMWDRKHKMSYQDWMKDINNIKDIASKNSAHYKKYGKNPDKVNLTQEQWGEITTNYQALLDSKGEREANNYLENAIARNVADNTAFYENLWHGFAGIGASATGAGVSALGMTLGAANYLTGVGKLWGDEYKDVQGLNGFQNFINAMIDNKISRYGNDIVKYGAFTPASMEEAKRSGISNLAIESYSGQGFLMDLNNLLSEGLSSQGFTVASILLSGGMSKALGWTTGKIGGALVAGKSGQALMATRKGLQLLQKTENNLNRYLVPAVAGTMEGAVEGLNTKQDVQKEALEQLDELHENKVGEKAKSIIDNDYTPVMTKDREGRASVLYRNKKTGKLEKAQDIYQSIWDSYMDEYNEALKQIDYASSAAGVDNFIFNSFINGAANSTLKATQMGERTKKALADRGLFKPFQRFTANFSVSGEGANTVVTPRMAKSKMVLNMLREPAGEALEEYEQNLSNEVASSAAKSNISTFINAKYNGDTQVKVGDTFASDWSAALTGFTDNLTSESSLKSALMGALGSAMGIPTLSIHSASTGNFRTDSNGNIVTDKNGKPIEERTWFGRGIKANGERESWFDRAARLTPWRSPMINAYREAKTEREAMEAKAQHLQEWLRKPENRAKWDGVVGTWSWAERMQKAADANDEFDYRNSHLGKMINDAFMLDAFKGTSIYETQINQLNEIANLEEGSEQAASYIQAIRDNVNLSSENKTDAEILEQLKENANNMLQTLDDIQTASSEIESTFGQVDEDAKQALIYNRLAEKDWANREQQLQGEVDKLQVTNSRQVKSQNSNLNTQQKTLIAQHGTLSKARESINKSNEQILKLEQDIKNLKDKKNRTKAQDRTLKQKQEKVKALREATIRETKVLDSMPKVSYQETQADGTQVLKERDMTDSDLVFNEQEIMAMNAQDRSQFLLRGAANRYNAVHGLEQTQEQSPYSAEQQAVIDNLVNQIGDQGLADIIDLGRIQKARENGAKVYAKVAIDRTGLYQYINAQKTATARHLTKQKYAHLNDITDYNEFRDEMDNLFKNGTMQERMVVRNMMKQSKNALWEKYSQQRQTVHDISNQLDAKGFTKDLNLNDMQLMDIISDYLVRNDVDMKDENAVISALSNINEGTGNSAIADYVNQYNQGREKPIVLDNISEVVGRYKEAIKQMNINQQARENITKPASETTGQSQPKKRSTLFDTASTDPNSGSGPKEVEIEEAPTEEPTELPPAPADIQANADGTISSPSSENPIISNLKVGQEIVGKDGHTYIVEKNDNGSVTLKDKTSSSGTFSVEMTFDKDEEFKDYFETPSGQEGEISTDEPVETPSNQQEFSPENRTRQTDDYSKAHKAEVLKRIHDKLAKATSKFTRFLTNKTNTSLEKYNKFIESLDTENMSEDEIFNAIENELKNNQEWDATLKSNLQVALNAVRNNMDDINNTVDEQMRKEEREQRSKAEQVTDDIVDRGIEFINPEEAYPDSTLGRLFASAGTRKYIDAGLLRWKRKYKKGKLGIAAEEKPKVKFLFDPVIANQVQNEMGNNYSADAIPIIVVYPLAQEEYKDYPNAIDIQGKKYMPVGVLPANNNTDAAGVATAKLIRNAIGDQTKKHFIQYDNKDIEATPRVKSPRLNSSNNKKNDRDVLSDVNAVGQNAIAEAERQAQDNNQQLSQEEKDKIGIKAIREFKNKIHKRLARIKRNVNNRTFFELSYQLPTLKGDNSVTNHLFREKSLGEITNSEGKSIQDLYNAGESLENFNQFFTDFATHLEEIITDAVDKQIPFGSIDNTKLNAQLNRDIYSTFDEYTIKSNDVGGYSLYLGDTELASVILDDNNKPNIDYQKLFNNLIMPNGSLRKNLNTQLDYEAMVNDDARGHYLFNRAIDAGVLRNGIQDPNWERSNRTVTCEIPIGLGKPVPAQRETRVVNEDGGNISGRNNDHVITPSGAQVDTQTGTDNHGNIPSNPVTDLYKKAMEIVNKIIADTKSINLTADEQNYEDGNRTLYERVTQFIRETKKEFSKLWATPSTNIGTTIDNFVRDFFELANENGDILTDENLNNLFGEFEDSDGRTYLKNNKTNKVYYNITRTQMRAFASQVVQLQKYFRNNGLTIIPNDVTVTGTVVDESGTHNIAGTLDILAVDRDGNFHIFDMKTHRWAYDKPSFDNKDITELEAHKIKWGKQLSLYKKFIEDKYLQGTPHRVVECAIIPIKVDYAEPTEAKPYTSVDEQNNTPRDQRINKLQYDGKNYNGATISLDLNGEPDGNGINTFEPISVRGDFFTNPEKAVGGTINPSTSPTNSRRNSLLDLGDQYQGSPNVEAGQEAQGETKAWTALTAEQKSALKKKWGISKGRDAQRKWNTMSAEQQNQELSCL